MFTNDYRVTGSRGFYKFTCNALWIDIYNSKTNELLFSRHADNGPWLDSKHNQIAKALEVLEKAITEAVEN